MFLPLHTPKNCTWASNTKTVLQQQEEEEEEEQRFPLPDLSAPPQIKIASLQFKPTKENFFPAVFSPGPPPRHIRSPRLPPAQRVPGGGGAAGGVGHPEAAGRANHEDKRAGQENGVIGEMFGNKLSVVRALACFWAKFS